jgi:hypothetical protein
MRADMRGARGIGWGAIACTQFACGLLRCGRKKQPMFWKK